MLPAVQYGTSSLRLLDPSTGQYVLRDIPEPEVPDCYDIAPSRTPPWVNRRTPFSFDHHEAFEAGPSTFAPEHVLAGDVEEPVEREAADPILEIQEGLEACELSSKIAQLEAQHIVNQEALIEAQSELSSFQLKPQEDFEQAQLNEMEEKMASIVQEQDTCEKHILALQGKKCQADEGTIACKQCDSRPL